MSSLEFCLISLTRRFPLVHVPFFRLSTGLSFSLLSSQRFHVGFARWDFCFFEKESYCTASQVFPDRWDKWRTNWSKIRLAQVHLTLEIWFSKLVTEESLLETMRRAWLGRIPCKRVHVLCTMIQYIMYWSNLWRFSLRRQISDTVSSMLALYIKWSYLNASVKRTSNIHIFWATIIRWDK